MMWGMSDHGDFFADQDGEESSEERLSQEAEELMRQGRFLDAAARYLELRRLSPTDLWARLGHASALECAGRVSDAAHVLEEAVQHHRRSRHMQRFRRMFFERREDPAEVIRARNELSQDVTIPDEPVDQLADLYFNQGRYHEALGELQRLLQEETIDDDDLLTASIHARMGACLRQGQHLDEARAALQQALAVDPENHWTLSELAECERASGNPSAARAHYQQALTINPDDHWCRGHLAQLEFEQGDRQQAEALYHDILEVMPDATWALVELAQVTAESNPQGSQELAEQALAIDPSYPWAYAHLGHLHRMQGKLDEAREFFAQALSASPGATWILLELADTCRHMGRLDEAFTHLEHARNSDPFDPTTYAFLGDILRSRGRLKQARAHFAKAVELDPGYAWAWRERAEIAALMDLHEEAQEAFAQVCALEPDEAINEGLQAFLLRCRGEGDQAEPHLRRAIAAMPSYAWAHRELCEHLLTRQRNQEAEEAARYGLHQIADFGPLRLLLAESLRRQQRSDEALTVLEQALAGEPDIPQLWAMRAEITCEHDPQKALSYARKAARLDSSSDFRLLLAQVLAACGDDSSCHAQARAVSRTHPNNAVAWVLLCDINERRPDMRAALVAARLGLRHCPDDWRLRTRAARLEWLQGQEPGLQRLQDVFAAPADTDIPWRDVALLFAHGGRGTECHRALAELTRVSDHHAKAQAECFRVWSECAVTLGNHEEALDAIGKAVHLAPDALPIRMLAAALLSQQDNGAAALPHLRHLHQHLPAESLSQRQLVLHQLATIHARQGQRDSAQACWDELGQLPPWDIGIAADYLQFLNDAGQWTLASAHGQNDIAQRSDAQLRSDDGQRLLSLCTLAVHHAHGPAAAATLLQHHDRCLGLAGRELLAQVHIGSGDTPAAEALLLALLQQTDETSSTSSQRLRWRCMHIRCLLARGANDQAWQDCQALVQEHPHSETPHCLWAEMLAYRGRYGDALMQLHGITLSRAPSMEHLLLRAVILLQCHGPEACQAWLQRWPLGSEIEAPPLLRVLIAAWPEINPAYPAGVPDSDDLGAFPPFTQAALHCVQALVQRGHTQAAGRLLGILAPAVQQLGGSARALWRQRALIACRCPGERRLALQAAWRARSILALLRCLIP